MYIGSQEMMKSYDQYLLHHGYTIEELVDKASDCLLKHFYEYQTIAILVGPGNNGADGLSLAIKLFQLQKRVHIFIFDDHKKISQANQYYLDLCNELDLDVSLLEEDKIYLLKEQLLKYDVIVDAIFGFGLNSSPRGIYGLVIDEINQMYDLKIIAVDIPTGLDCNSGNPYSCVISATKTITFCALKNGFLNPTSQMFTGEIIVEQLDIEDIALKVGLFQVFDHHLALTYIKDRIYDGHKGTYGRVMMITGCDEYKGAAFLSGKAAVYSGSGVVTVMSSESVVSSLTQFCPEATTLLRPSMIIKEDLEKYNAVLIGSGLGLSIDAYRHVKDVLSFIDKPLVVDGDALTILSQDMGALKDINTPVILTPHMGEFQRLCPLEHYDDILKIASEFAKENHIILVLKGPHTIVTDGDNSFRIGSGNKAMASGGMGDVLAGVITSLVGQGYDPLIAACLGVYIHGYAGDMLEKDNYTVLASKVIEMIPKAMKKIKSNL